MEERVVVEEDVLRKVYRVLKDRGFSIPQISEKIGSEFKNHLYKQTSFTKKSFDKLESLYGESIQSNRITYVDGRGKVEVLELDKNELLAELVGMILGDGHIDSHSYDRGDRYVSSHYVSITLSSEEREIIERANFLAEKCLDRGFNEEELVHADAVNLKIYGKDVVLALENVGLISGNKVDNQVGVPEWIMEDLALERRCIKGLFDTDGSYYRRSEDGYKVVYFKNKSYSLLSDFIRICEDLGIKTSRAGNDAVQVSAQEEVEKFVEQVDPIKAS